MKCICNKRKKTICLLHQEKQRMRKGWISVDNQGRSVRDREHGLFGQEIWFKLAKAGFVRQESLAVPLTKFEEKLKNWLIWGYWEKI